MVAAIMPASEFDSSDREQENKCLTNVSDMQALSKVEGITPEHVKVRPEEQSTKLTKQAYGSKILGITLKYINKARAATNTTTTAGTGAAIR